MKPVTKLFIEGRQGSLAGKCEIKSQSQKGKQKQKTVINVKSLWKD